MNKVYEEEPKHARIMWVNVEAVSGGLPAGTWVSSEAASPACMQLGDDHGPGQQMDYNPKRDLEPEVPC